MRPFVLNGAVVAALLLAFLGRALGEGEVAGEDAQVAAAEAEGGQENGFNDIAVGGVWHNSLLYVAISTDGALENSTEYGLLDLVVKSYTADLEEDGFVRMGGSGDDVITAIAAGPNEDSPVYIIGSTTSADLFPDIQPDEKDWFIASLDRGNLSALLGSYVANAQNEQEATAVAVASDNSGIVVAGWTRGSYISDNAGAGSDRTSNGYDTWVVKLSPELDEDPLWEKQFGTTAFDEPSAVVIDSDNNVYVVGTTANIDEVLDPTEEDAVPSMFVYSFTEGGDIRWNISTELGNMSNGSQAHGAVLSEDEDVLYLSGNTRGVIPGYDGEATGADELFVASLDVTNGDINWVWQSEASATAFGTGGIVLADDGSPIVGGIAFGNQFNLSFTYWEDGSGDMIAAKIDTEEQKVSKYFVAAAASNKTREDPFAMVKRDGVDDGVYLIGSQDGDFDEEGFEPEETSNYLVLSVELEGIPGVEDSDDDDDDDFPFYSIGLAVFAVVGVVLLVGFKWRATKQAVKAKRVSGV